MVLAANLRRMSDLETDRRATVPHRNQVQAPSVGDQQAREVVLDALTTASQVDNVKGKEGCEHRCRWRKAEGLSHADECVVLTCSVVEMAAWCCSATLRCDFSK